MDTGQWKAEDTGDRGNRVKFEGSEDPSGGFIAEPTLPTEEHGEAVGSELESGCLMKGLLTKQFAHQSLP